MTAEQIAEALWSHVPVTNWVRWCKAVQIALGADEIVPRAVADELAEALREALIDVGAKGVDDPFTMRGARVGREALAKYEEAVERPDDDTYGPYNADGTPKRALRRVLDEMENDA